jgi:hypothetical protein
MIAQLAQGVHDLHNVIRTDIDIALNHCLGLVAGERLHQKCVSGL